MEILKPHTLNPRTCNSMKSSSFFYFFPTCIKWHMPSLSSEHNLLLYRHYNKTMKCPWWRTCSAC
eukprot:c25204_g2_i1 orf=75-269(-)